MTVSKHVRRILILGDTGFIGTRIKKYLGGSFPHIKVIGRSKPELDLTEEEDLTTLVPFLDPSTVVIMCAGIKKQLGDSLDSFSQNLQMAVNVCKLLQEHPVLRLIFFSSAAVYGEDREHGEITEKTPTQPTSYYGLAKYASEQLFQKAYNDSRSLGSLVILRPTLVYGPCDPAGTYGPSGFVRAAARGETITLWGDGGEQREFVFVDDVAKIVYYLSLQNYSGIFNVASGTGYTFKEALDMASRLVGVSIKHTSRPRTRAKVDHRYDNTALRKMMPAVTFTNLEEGMRRTLESEVQGADRPKNVVGWFS
jgi:UDP-glucose 4-epimerase